MAVCDSTSLVKQCSTCEHVKPATTDYFHANKGGKYGLRGRCRECHKAAVRESIKRPDIAANRKRLHQSYVASGRYAEMKRDWRNRNLDKARASTAAWKVRNPEQTKETARLWRDANRDKVRAKQRRADAKIQSSPIHVLNKRVKARIRGMLRGGYESGTIGEFLGFTKAELVAHIERQFTKGMTWERLVAGEIHIDHIIPVAAFNIKEIGDAEFRACWALSNLRPLWEMDNWKKQKKVLTLL
ncbi:hypothetical protein ACYKDZ_17675 [Stutzerimonas stutzeri]